MRKNKRNSEKLKCALFSTYRVKGYNLDNFLNAVHGRDIEVYSAKKVNNTTLIFNVKYNDNKTFLALAKELCYNVKKLRDGGRLYPFLYLYKNLGVVLGGILFFVSTFFFNDFVLGFEFTGTGSVYAPSVIEFLEEQNVKKFTRFSSLNLRTLGDSVLKGNERLTFVSCEKVGNTLKFNLVLSNEKVPILKMDSKSLCALEEGVIVQQKVYRGTALKNVGDFVTAGELLVDGYTLVKEEKIETFVLAEIKIKSKKEFYFEGVSENQTDTAIMLAKEYYSGIEATAESVIVKQNGEKYNYIVTLEYIYTLISN